jgi:hypothetical protein
MQSTSARRCTLFFACQMRSEGHVELFQKQWPKVHRHQTNIRNSYFVYTQFARLAQLLPSIYIYQGFHPDQTYFDM